MINIMAGEVKKNEKLTYEQLEAYANQTAAQAKRIYQENQALIQENRNLKNQMNYTEISLAFKALDHKEFFSEEFIKKVAARLEEVLTPMEPPKAEEPTEQPENKE